MTAIAAVGCHVAIALPTAPRSQPPGHRQFLAVTIVGGVACGGAVAASGSLAWPAVTEDPLVEITFTNHCLRTLLLAWRIRWTCPGLLATLTAGNQNGPTSAHGRPSAEGREAVVSFWDYAAFRGELAESPADGDAGAHQNFTHRGVCCDRHRIVWSLRGGPCPPISGCSCFLGFSA